MNRDYSGQNNPNYKEGLTHNKKCPDCGASIVYGASKCRKCAHKRPILFTVYTQCCDCGKQIWKPSKRCRSCSSKGSLGSNWKGGITSLALKIRMLPEMRAWRIAVFERDDYTCQICGKRGCKLNADHKYPFKWILDKFNIKSVEDALKCNFLWDISNGQTLCETCHRQTKTFAGRIKKLTNKKGDYHVRQC